MGGWGGGLVDGGGRWMGGLRGWLVGGLMSEVEEMVNGWDGEIFEGLTLLIIIAFKGAI